MNLKELAKLRGTNLKRISEQTQIPASTLYAISQGETTFDNVGVSRFLKRLCLTRYQGKRWTMRQKVRKTWVFRNAM